MDGADGNVALLPMEPGDMSGDLVKSDTMKPGAPGVTIYLDSKGDPEGMIERAVAAGGQMGMPVTDMGEMVGFHRLLRRQRGQPHRRAQAAESGLTERRSPHGRPVRGGAAGGRRVRPPPRLLFLAPPPLSAALAASSR